MPYKYVGDGAWIPGVPARDLTDAEAKEYGITEDGPVYKRAKSVEDKRAKDKPEDKGA